MIDYIREYAVPIVCGLIGAFIGLAIQRLLGLI